MSSPDHGKSYRQFPPYVSQLGLNRAPFARDDEAFFYPHPAFNQRLEMLLNQVEGEGLVMVSGEHDSGKSTLIQHLLACNDGGWLICRVDADPMCEPAVITERLFTVFGDEGEIRGTLADLSTRLRARRARDLKPILIVDNAHLLPERSLELVLDMCTWRDAEGILIQGLLFTEPQIKNVLQLVPDELLDRAPMQQIYINAFPPAQTADYLLHRLRLAGLEGDLPFDEEELNKIQRTSQGLPGRIDKAAHRALLAHALDSKGKKKERKREAKESAGVGDGRRLRRFAIAGAVLAAMAGVAYGLLVPLSNEGTTPPATPPEPEREVHALELPPPPPMEAPQSAKPVSQAKEPEVLIRAAKPEEERRAATPPPATTAVVEQEEPKAEPLAPPPMPDALTPPPSPSPATVAQRSAPTPEPVVAEPAPIPTPTKTAVPKPTTAPMNEQSVLALAPEKYTIQLMSNESEALVREFIDEHGLRERTALVRLRYPNGADKYTVLLGLYDWNRDAKTAIAELPAVLRAYHPWSRNVSHIQQELRKLGR